MGCVEAGLCPAATGHSPVTTPAFAQRYSVGREAEKVTAVITAAVITANQDSLAEARWPHV